MTRSCKLSPPLRFSYQSCVRISYVPQASLIPFPCHPPLFDDHNNIWRTMQGMDVLLVLFSSVSLYFTFLRSKYYPKHPVLNHPQSVSSPSPALQSCEGTSASLTTALHSSLFLAFKPQFLVPTI